MISATKQTPKTLPELEVLLRDLSHNRQATTIIQEFSSSLKNTKERQEVFSKNGALVQAPIFFDDLAEETRKNIEPFALLSGDIVKTNCAYYLGDRLEGTNMKFVVASSTCDLVPQRRNSLSLFKITPLWKDKSDAKQILGESLKFNSSKRMYLPPLGDDNRAIAANIVSLDDIIQIKSEDLILSKRCASLSLVGWRVFSSLIRDFFIRTGEGELLIRAAANSPQKCS